MLDVLVVAIIVISAVWVYWDATKNKIGKVPGAGGMLNMSAGAWSVVSLFLWIIAFPAYLIKRSALIERAKGQPVEVRGRIIKLVILAAIGGLWVLVTLAAAFAPPPTPQKAEPSPPPVAKAPAAQSPVAAPSAPKLEPKPEPAAGTPTASAAPVPAESAAATAKPAAEATKPGAVALAPAKSAAVEVKPAPAKPVAVAEKPAAVAAAPAKPAPVLAMKEAASMRAPAAAAEPAGEKPKSKRRAAPRKPAAAPSETAMAPAAPPKTPRYNDVMTAVMSRDRAGAAEALDAGFWADRRDSNGVTPLMAAAMNGDTAMVQLLLKHGANPNLSGPGSSVLSYANRSGDGKLVELLRKAGAR